MIKMLRGIPVQKPCVNLQLHELENLTDMNGFKILNKSAKWHCGRHTPIKKT